MLVNHYATRWPIGFRDTKDLRFGMGLSSTRVGEPMRRGRLLLVSAFAVALLTLLGRVGESLGMDRLLKSNTLISNMPEHRLAPPGLSHLTSAKAGEEGCEEGIVHPARLSLPFMLPFEPSSFAKLSARRRKRAMFSGP